MSLKKRAVRSLSLSTLIGALMIIPPPSLADEPISREQMAEQLQQRYGGRVLDLQAVGIGEQMVYRVKLLQPSGRVKLMLVDAVTGKVMPFKGSQ